MLTLYMAQEPLVVEGYRLRGRVYWDMWGRRLIIDLKIIVIGEAFSWESFPHCIGSW